MRTSIRPKLRFVSSLALLGCAAAQEAAAQAPVAVGDRIELPSRAPGLHGTFRADGVVVADRDAAGDVGIRLAAWGRAGALVTAEPVPPTGQVRGVEYRRAGVTEWWESRPEGLEQGFDVPSPPAGDGALVFDLVVTGATVSVDGGEATLVRPSGSRLRYAGLAAWDATGQDLPARMEPTADGVRLVVDDARAIGAITVDPVLSATAAWTAEADQAAAYLGGSVASAGDVNGDGYPDVIAGAILYTGDVTDEGGAFVYYGSPTGLPAVADWIASGDQVNSYFGISVASAGDVNGDGYDDVIVGASAYNSVEYDMGRAYVYHGSAAGLSAVADWIAEPEQANTHFGWPVASAGDVNGDGYADVVVGAYGYDGGEDDEGRAYVYHGSAAGLSATPAWTAESDRAGAFFGSSVASAGDVNADGYDDVVVGAWAFGGGKPYEGAAYAWFGSAAGLSAVPDWMVEGNQASANFGWSVASAGDVNGDGFDDVVVGSDFYDGGTTREGAALVFHGSAAGPSLVADWIGESDQQSAYLGYSVAAAGDVDGDGYGDVIAGAVFYDGGELDEGRVYLYRGSATGLTTAVDEIEADQAGAVFGTSVASAGDVDGDGYDDVLVGAPAYDAGEADEGRVFLYTGGTSDHDGDGSSVPGDCDDADPTVYPGAPEIVADGIDQDCDEVDACYEDTDRDDLGTSVVVPGSSLDCGTGSGAPVPGDNCPTAWNAKQEDGDGDGAGDSCDICPLDPADDSDGDGSCDGVDTCAGADDLLDTDADGQPDGCDACPLDPTDTCETLEDTDIPDDTDTDADPDTDPDTDVADPAKGGCGCRTAPSAPGTWAGLVAAVLLLARVRRLRARG